jgi:hypothetical protein
VVQDGLGTLYIGATTDMAHSTLGHLRVWRHRNTATHGWHLSRHLRRRSRVAVLLHRDTRGHSRRSSLPLSHLTRHGILVHRIELTRGGRGGHGGSLRRRDTIPLRHSGGDTISLGEIHLLMDAAGRILRLLVVLLGWNDGRSLMGGMCLLHLRRSVGWRRHGPDGRSSIRGTSLVRTGQV